MITESKIEVVDEDFYWKVTRFVYFELEYCERPTIIKSHNFGLIEKLIKFHEGQENYEICNKIMKYKERINHV